MEFCRPLVTYPPCEVDTQVEITRPAISPTCLGTIYVGLPLGICVGGPEVWRII